MQALELNKPFLPERFTTKAPNKIRSIELLGAAANVCATFVTATGGPPCFTKRGKERIVIFNLDPLFFHEEQFQINSYRNNFRSTKSKYSYSRVRF